MRIREQGAEAGSDCSDLARLMGLLSLLVHLVQSALSPNAAFLDSAVFQRGRIRPATLVLSLFTRLPIWDKADDF
ncbi:MAG TPA: hypothetical protein VEC99_15760 [Clostridia bacterium]|nr:hypothetical protein [Clostridia bacterium]